VQAPEPPPTWFQAPVQPTSRVLVKLRPGAAALRGAREIPKLGIFVIEARAGNVDETLRLMNARPDIEWAEREVRLPANTIPADPSYVNQWYLPKIDAPGAWAVTMGASVTIAILDTGVDPAHEDLLGHMVPGYNFFDNNTDTHDVYGHGTQVAGAAAAIGGNSIGVVGVAWGARIMPLRVAGPDGYANTGTIAEALVWAADHGARVANVSFAASDYLAVGTGGEYFQQRGGVVTVSAGNEGATSSSPDNPFVLTISASSNLDNITSWSNRGNNVDLAAPGTMLFTTSNGGGYGYASGTSFSAPVTAGVAALVMSANPTLTGVQVQEILKRSADDLGPTGWDQGYGWGRVNAARAVAMANGTMPSPTATVASPSPTATPGDTQAPSITITSPSDGQRITGRRISVTVTAADNVRVARVELFVDGALQTNSITPPFTLSVSVLRKGTHTLRARALDAAGNTGEQTITVYR